MRLSIPAALAAAFAWSASAQDIVPGVEPNAVASTAEPGTSFDIEAVVTTPEILQTPDIVLLVSVTDTMPLALANLKRDFPAIYQGVVAEQPTAQFAIVSYTEMNLPNPVTIVQDFTGDQATLQAAVDSLTAAGDSGSTDDWINALNRLVPLTWRADSSRIVVLIGDKASNDPSNGFTLDYTIEYLQGKGTRVIAVDVNQLDRLGQATQLAQGTDGAVIDSAPDAITGAILEGLSALPVTVTPEIVTCDASLRVSFEPDEIEVESGKEATFIETIAVSETATAGSVLLCSVQFLLNGEDGGTTFTQSISITVGGPTPPSVECRVAPNKPCCGRKTKASADRVSSSGKSNSGKSRSEKRGYNNKGKSKPAPKPVPKPDVHTDVYVLNARDGEGNPLPVMVRDPVSGAEFGPFPSGTRVRFIEDPNAEPCIKRGTKSVPFIITVNGCPDVTAVDSDNQSVTSSCCALPGGGLVEDPLP